MKNIILLTTTFAAALGTVTYLMKRKRKTPNTVHEFAKKSYHRTNVFAKAKSNNG